MSLIQRQIFHHQRACLLAAVTPGCGPIIPRSRGLPQAPSRLHRSLWWFCVFLPSPSYPEAEVGCCSLAFLFSHWGGLSLLPPGVIISSVYTALGKELRSSSSCVSLFLPTQAFLESQGLGRQMSSLQSHLHSQSLPFYKPLSFKISINI